MDCFDDLIMRFRALDAQDVLVVGEVGFGAGLYCLLAWQLFLKHAPKHARLVIYTAEAQPLDVNQLKQCLSAWPNVSREAALLLDAYPVLMSGMYPLIFDNRRVQINLMLGDAVTHFRSLLVCGKPALEAKLKPWGIHVWMGAHHDVDKAALTLLNKPHTPWAVSAPIIKPHNQKKHAIVIGAGLAGCFSAYALSQRGFQVSVLDSASHIGAGASGVEKAVLYPDVSAYRSPVSTWMLHAFLFATQMYSAWLKAGKIQGELNGILQFSDKIASALAERVDAKKASKLAGLNIKSDALFVKQAGWLDTRALCEFLVNRSNIDFQPNTSVHDLATLDAPVVVLANGVGIADYAETQHFPIELFRGQMSAIESNAVSSTLKLPLCGAGHILPEDNHMHWIGASYEGGISSEISQKDNLNNLAKLKALPVQDICPNQVIKAWAGVRAKTPDYLPLVGPVPNAAAFQKRFSGLSKDAKRFIASPGVYYPGLYVCAGFGSRGLTSIPLAAEHLASMICNEPTWLSREMTETLSPARFLVKAIKRYVIPK
jgi:tRNA 5-methylaminomethyl-2-thiouridine biosynthesis bifunctional protein